MSGGVTRRGVLAGAVAMPWLVACSPVMDKPAGVDLEDGTFSSRFWPGQAVRWRLARPHRGATGTATQPLVVALHGHGGDADWPFTGVHVERQVVPTGLAVASVDGGDFYWHARGSGIDTGRMVVEELLPLLGSKGLATDRVALIGWSMGGYGALLMATILGPERVAGVVAASAALWQSPGDSAAGAFDDREDFVRNDVFAARGRLRGIPVRLDCGRDDPFIVANRAFAHELPDAAVTFDDGAHTEEYWTAHAGAQMRWLQACFH
jgi:pimeloyl-ACP methyl ester carboxylesterase